MVFRAPHKRWLRLALVLVVLIALFLRFRFPDETAADQALAMLERETEWPVGPAGANSEQKETPAQSKPDTGRAGRVADNDEQGTVEELLQIVPAPAEAARIEARVSTPTGTIVYAQVNRELFEGKRSPFLKPDNTARVVLPLPNGEKITVRVVSTEYLAPKRWVVRGQIEDRKGGQVIIAYSDGAVAAQIDDTKTGQHQLRTVSTDTGSIGQYYTVDEGKVGGCGGSPLPLVNAEPGARLSVDAAAVGLSSTRASGSADGMVEVTLMMLFSQDVAQFYTLAGAQAQVDLAVASVNQDLADSEAKVRIRLVRSESVPLTEVGLKYSRTVDQLALPGDGVLDQVHTWRDQSGADLVSLGVLTQDESTVGLAYLLRTPGSSINALNAFSIVKFPDMATRSVLAHELGHNFGCAHDTENSERGGTYPYSYGYRFTAVDAQGTVRTFRDIMAYAPGDRVPYFSNPRIKLARATITTNGSSREITIPSPVPVGDPARADNARTIEQNAFEVSAYRRDPNETNAAGSLVNISTRAFVGSGSRQLIGDFIVRGSGTKKVLVRAAGPALAPYLGSAGILADPVLRVYSLQAGNGLLDTNDDWTDARTVVGSFPFAAGSKDAALLLDLPAGAYTANVEGKSGASGIALVEAYERESSGGNRVINLSTRAYADTEKPIVAGFVVNADPAAPGQPKRILVRVLGPTLANATFQIAEAMPDPVIRLYNSRGDLLLENDDWDPPTTSLGSTVVSTRAQVDGYSELEIDRVVKALRIPAMRPTEPAILVDLHPGSYTVNVLPFTGTGNNPSPAQAGVAVVEVYEVDLR